MKECKNTVCFGPGFRKSSVVRSVSLFPSQRPEEIALQVDPIESFRFEKVTSTDGDAYRIRSDVSMLLHAADMAKKYGSGFVQSMIDMRRPKSSSIQSQMDQMTDAQILDTVKSRHLQSPSELIAWSEYLIEQAKDVEQEAERITLEKEASAAEASASESQPQSESQSE